MYTGEFIDNRSRLGGRTEPESFFFRCEVIMSNEGRGERRAEAWGAFSFLLQTITPPPCLLPACSCSCSQARPEMLLSLYQKATFARILGWMHLPFRAFRAARSGWFASLSLTLAIHEKQTPVPERRLCVVVYATSVVPSAGIPPGSPPLLCQVT